MFDLDSKKLIYIRRVMSLTHNTNMVISLVDII